MAGGGPLADYVQRQLGHADIGTTERYYGHLERHVLAAGAIAAEEAIPLRRRLHRCARVSRNSDSPDMNGIRRGDWNRLRAG